MKDDLCGLLFLGLVLGSCLLASCERDCPASPPPVQSPVEAAALALLDLDADGCVGSDVDEQGLPALVELRGARASNLWRAAQGQCLE